jgi:hypothetical protein
MKKLVLFVLIASALASCKNLVPYTDSMKKEHGWTLDQLKGIQFYLSHDVILRRELSKGSSEIIHGKIRTVNGRKVDEILIKAGTPGILTDMPRENKMLVSFEVGDDHYLSFGVNPNKSDRYVLLASEWNNGMGKVHYSGEEYYTDPDSHYAILLVDLHKINNTTLSQHVAKGRKLN